MTTPRNLRDELLTQNGIGTQKADEFREKILARDQAAVARMRKLTIYSWTLVAVSLVIAGIVRILFPDVIEFKPQLVPLFITVWNGLFLIATIFTISLYVRSRTLTMHQIQSSLALIEQHLKKMSERD